MKKQDKNTNKLYKFVCGCEEKWRMELKKTQQLFFPTPEHHKDNFKNTQGQGICFHLHFISHILIHNKQHPLRIDII